MRKKLITKLFSPRIFSLAFVIVYTSSLIHIGESAPRYSSHACVNSTTGALTQNSTYLSNLNLLLSYLNSNATVDGGFYQTTVASGTPDASTGFFQCRGDITAAVCRECVGSASREVLRRCPQQKEAVIWYDSCWIRYQDLSSFSPNPGIVPSTSLESSQTVAETERFNDLLSGVMNKLVDKAANSGSAKKFATDEANFTGSQTLYSLVQCTPDLSAADCTMCLRSAIGSLPECCGGKRGGSVFLPSCITRYEFFPFYNSTSTSTSTEVRPPGKTKISLAGVVSTVVVLVVAVLLFTVGCSYLRRRMKKKSNSLITQENVNDLTTIESLQFKFKDIEIATKKFSDSNMLGKGGFGEVYKGMLVDGQEIAVKRLSKSSGQGATEFKNEVVLVAKLQHKNLVRLLGFCMEGDEKILVYEYVPNRSLDYFIFDPKKQDQLNWSIRCNIIEGIARGILYLHEDSRLKIIHRDLKAGNILLDKNMNPKVSDFGMAKLFGVDQTQGNTRRIVGTYGYMAPEYAMEGIYSIKSDIYSFGVLLLEILSGRRNSSFHMTDCAPSLVAYAWQLWNEGKTLDLIDPSMKDSCYPNELMRYIHIALLCVQEDAHLRPTMSVVLLTLKSDAPSLSQPERPAFITSRITSHQEIIALNSGSVNEMTASDFPPR